MKLKVEKWYDKYSKRWVIQTLDEKDCQIGEATYAYSTWQSDQEVKRRRVEIRRNRQ